MDAETIRTVAELARQRAERGTSAAQGDGMARLGASRALLQLAADLDVTADHIDHPRRTRHRRA